MKRIRTKLIVLLLSVAMLTGILSGSYQTAQAAEFIGGAAAAEESLQFIFSIMAGMGMSISLKELFRPREAEIKKDLGVQSIDWDNYDWGDMLDSPAAQDQIDQTEKWINELYGNASETWKKKYHESLTPTPKPDPSKPPEVSPPVTVPPIDPDSVTPPAWNDLKRAALKNKYLTLGAATYWCLKEAVTGFWDNIIGKNTETVYDESYFELLEGVNPHDGYPKLAGTTYHEVRTSSNIDCYYTTMYVPETASYIVYTTNINSRMQYWTFYDSNDKQISLFGYTRRVLYTKTGIILSDSMLGKGGSSSFANTNLSDSNRTIIANFNLPIYIGSKSDENLDKSIKKPAIWPSTDLKGDYDKNTSPTLPDKPPAPAIKVPTIDEIKDLQKKANNADDEKRPVIIQDFVTNHYTTPSVDPNPKPDPEPDPKPDPKPTTAPEEDTNVNPDDYKADLRLVFPFCIPFDLVHLIQAFEAEAQAPVFEFPLDLELENPWTGKKILDYHHTFKLDMSDYEPVIKIFRIFEIIFFIIGLLMITRQHMIKG